jgi:hypothetical protein
MMVLENVFNDYNEMINRVSSTGVKIDFHKVENSVRFIMEDDVRLTPRALVANIDDVNRIEIFFEEIEEKLFVFSEFHCNISNFEGQSRCPLVQTIFMSQICADYEAYKAKISFEIAKQIDHHKERVLCLCRPSRSLGIIVGHKDMYRYQILDQISQYVANNNLFVKTGWIKIDRLLAPMFSSRLSFVSEKEFLRVLKKNIEKIT